MGGEHPDWLPVDWRVSVKVRSFGRKDKYYINPNGLTFNSKPEVLRFLKSSGKFRKPKKSDKIEIKKTVAEKLPPGWIKEIRTKKKGSKTRRDPYYIDPVSGRHFRSMQEVFRYLKSKDSGEAGSKPDDEGHLNMELGDHSQSSSAEAKGQRLTDKKGEKILTGHESVKSDPNVVALKDTEKSVLKQGEKEHSVAGNLLNKLPQTNANGRNGGRRKSKRLADSELKDIDTKDQSLESGSEAVAEKNINVPENNGLEQREKENSCMGEEGQQHKELALQNKRKKSNSKWVSDLPRRTSKRLARLEVDPSIEVKTRNRAGASARLSGEGEADTTKNVDKSGLSDEQEIDTTGKSGRMNDSNEHPSKCRRENPTNNKLKKPTPEDLSSIEEHKGVDVDCNEHEKHEKHLDSSLKDLLMDPCIEFAIKTLTGAIPIEDVNKVCDSPVSSLASPNQTSASSSVLPSGDIWSDPCFEFAVKTLTGEMPTEDWSQFQISLQKPLSSSGASGRNSLTLPKFRLDSIHPSSYSFSQFDAVKKPCMRQQGGRDPPFPHAINGSSQNSVNTGLHQGFQGRRGNFM